MFVRLANPEDADSISGLMAQLGYPASPALLEEKLRAFESDPLDQVFVAVLNDRLVGVVSCHVTSLFHQAGSLGRITSFVVDENLRGRGAGKSLLAEAEKFFQSSGCVRYEVTSGDHRGDAHDFYRANGFTEDERRFVKSHI